MLYVEILSGSRGEDILGKRVDGFHTNYTSSKDFSNQQFILSMTLYTSGDWKVDPNKDITFPLVDWLINQFPVLKNTEIEVNQVDLDGEFASGFCQDNDGEFLIHIHNDLSYEDYVTTLIHELVHVKQTLQGLKDHEMRESEAYFWERLLCKEYMTTPISGTQPTEIPA